MQDVGYVKTATDVSRQPNKIVCLMRVTVLKFIIDLKTKSMKVIVVIPDKFVNPIFEMKLVQLVYITFTLKLATKRDVIRIRSIDSKAIL